MMAIMEDEHSLLAWAKNERLAILDDLEGFKNGLRTQESRDGGPWTDTTEHEVVRQTGRLRRIEKYIAKHETPDA